MKQITLVNNKGYAEVDDDDYERAIKHRWYLQKSSSTNYAQSKYKDNGKWISFGLHQLIMNTLGTKHKVDHKDRNGLNNTKDNLRIASHSDNIKNRRKHRGTSKYTGVNLHLYGKWLAKININGKQKHIGTFDNEIDAARAYNKAAIETGNPFYNLNDV